MGPALLIFGACAGLGGWLLLRRAGQAWRIGRLLSAAPARSLAEAVALAERGEEAYVRLHARIDSDEEFPSEDDQPLVYQRRRLQHRDGRGRWQTFDDERLAVPFHLSEQGQRVTIDGDALGDGLVVVPRESEGVAADVADAGVGRTLPDLPPQTPVRLLMERISAVDHATAAGVPRRRPDGSVWLGPGLGRPLLLTTLEQDEAMRVLAGSHRTEVLLAGGLLAVAPVAAVAGLIALVIGR